MIKLIKAIKDLYIYFLTLLPNPSSWQPITKEMIDWWEEYKNFD